MGTRAMATNHRQQSLLPRQGSFYSLTLDEVQIHLGEPLHSMNLDDLLKIVYLDIENSTACYSEAGLQNQSITMNRAWSKKTVDEVWKDIQQKKSTEGRSSNPTLGETTLEDFLMKAGIVREGVNHPSSASANLGSAEEPLHWLMQAGPGSDQHSPGRKRGSREDVEDKTVERRQKRMIKNRESAARSRARKQAYTNELENKVSRLEEENERLRKQMMLDSLLFSAASPQEQKNQLRRSCSTSF